MCVWALHSVQLCCSVLDSMGGAESYRVSVSCVGSPARVQGLDSVPAPQSQKNLGDTHTHTGSDMLGNAGHGDSPEDERERERERS